MEEDNFSFWKIMVIVFLPICVFSFGGIMLLDYFEGNDVSSATYPEGFPEITQTEYSGATRTDSNTNTGYIPTVGPTPTIKSDSFVVVVEPSPTLIYSDVDENGVYTSSPNKDDIDKIHYKVVIDGIESIVTLNSNRETNDEWIINKTVVGNDKENVTLVEYMRYDGTTYEVIER